MNTLEKLKIYIENNLEQPLLEEFCFMGASLEQEKCFKRACKVGSLDTFMEQEKLEDTFTSLLLSYIDRMNLKDSDIYHKANIDRRLFSKIRSNSNYHPKKETVIALGLALELNIEDFIKLLESASYSLPKNNVSDLIIRFCITEKIYNLIEVNSLLSEYQCPLIGTIEKDA